MLESTEKFQRECIKRFADILERAELYPYFKTGKLEEMIEILKPLEPIGKRLIVDFGGYSNFDCFEEINSKNGLIYIVWHYPHPRLILKPEEMLVNVSCSDKRKNYIFIRNAALNLNSKKDCVLEKQNENVLIHPKGSYYTNSAQSYKLMQKLREGF